MELTGTHVLLQPLGPEHAAGLVHAAGQRRDAYQWAPVPRDLPEAQAYVQSRLTLRDAGTWFSFATIRRSDGEVVGSTSFLNIERWDWPGADGDPDTVEIGSTWLAASAQRTAINTEAKYLMLAHAFDVWHVQQVQIKTDARNQRSRVAIERLGAHFEGVLRRYQPAQGDVGQGGVRDTAMYSVIEPEWPGVRTRLLAKLAEPD